MYAKKAARKIKASDKQLGEKKNAQHTDEE